MYEEIVEHVFAPRTATFFSPERVQVAHEAVFTEVFANVVEHEFVHRTLMKLEGFECCKSYDKKFVRDNTLPDSFDPSSEQMQKALIETLNPSGTSVILKCVGCGGMAKVSYPLDKPFFCKYCDNAIAGRNLRTVILASTIPA